MPGLIVVIVLASFLLGGVLSPARHCPKEPTKPHISLGASLDSKLVARGAASKLSFVFHRANPDDSLIPKSWQEAGIKPIAWSLFDAGLGKQSQVQK